MPLCRACQTLPFRQMLKQLSGDKSVRNVFQWFHPPGTVSTDEDMKRAFVKWHKSLPEMKDSARTCSFCHVIHSRMEDNWRYQAHVQTNDKRQIWLEVPRSNPTVFAWIGNETPEAMISGNYRFSTTPDSSVAQFFNRDFAVLQSSVHPAVFTQMDVWLKNCNEGHQKCASLQGRFTPMPTRLLDLTSLPAREEAIHVLDDWHSLFDRGSCKLLENAPGTNGRYVALSYCWGKTLAYTTTSINREAHKQDGGIPFRDLPKTLQDAIFVTRYLGIDYLWADCLCIIQDDKADWEHEAARMADVYSNAYLTVAATRANHSGEGFLQPRKVNDLSVHFVDGEGEFDLYFIYDDCTISPGSMEAVTHQPLRVQRGEPLLDRVWCFQERVLAVRTLHFATDQMYWECSHSFEQERGIVCDNERDFYKEYSLKTISEDRDAWYRMVEEYTSRNMTYQSDKLPAISGVISALQKLTGDKCYAGIWHNSFMLGLLWRIQVPELDVYVFAPKQPQRVGFWRAPSWSWTSLEGVVLYDIAQRFYTSWDIITQLTECTVVPSGKNPLGELKSGHVKLDGPLTTLTAIPQDVIGHTSNGKACTVRLAQHRRVYSGVYFDLETYDTCDVLMITPYMGLAIRPIDSKLGAYVRVGAVVLYMRMGVVNDAGDPVFPGDPDSILSASDHLKPTSITLF